MSSDRDELRRLVDNLTEERLPDVLAEVRRHLTPASDGPGRRCPRVIVCDTGPIVAAALDNDDHHYAVKRLKLSGLHSLFEPAQVTGLRSGIERGQLDRPGRPVADRELVAGGQRAVQGIELDPTLRA
jgi:hypothetical protein